MFKQLFANNALHTYSNVMDFENYKRLILLIDQAYEILKKEETLNYNKIEKWIKFGKKKKIRFLDKCLKNNKKTLLVHQKTSTTSAIGVFNAIDRKITQLKKKGGDISELI